MNDKTLTLTVDASSPLLIGYTAAIVSAYVARNSVPPGEMPALIASTHAALAGLGAPAAPSEPEVERPTPAQIRKSVTPDAITSFLDGKPYKTLKRHLGTHGLTPEQYRERFGLPVDYPMVCSTYAAQRSELAKSSGLGNSRNRHLAAVA